MKFDIHVHTLDGQDSNAKTINNVDSWLLIGETASSTITTPLIEGEKRAIVVVRPGMTIVVEAK